VTNDYRVNDPEQIRAAAVAGLGIARNARSLFGKDIAAARAVRYSISTRPSSIGSTR
jgi:DNA-binding transcriptional LysR family regulator